MFSYGKLLFHWERFMQNQLLFRIVWKGHFLCVYVVFYIKKWLRKYYFSCVGLPGCYQITPMLIKCLLCNQIFFFFFIINQWNLEVKIQTWLKYVLDDCFSVDIYQIKLVAKSNKEMPPNLLPRLCKLPICWRFLSSYIILARSHKNKISKMVE